MNKETEIKLRASRATLATLRDHPLLAGRNRSGWQRVELYNQYYDTANRDLAHARVALRLRRDGEQFIQTLKSRGQSVAGLSERNEWDWYLQRPELDPALLGDDCWPASLAELDKASLQPLFTTDFVREKADIGWGEGEDEVLIEAALDLGKVLADGREEEICELELELRKGRPEALLELAIGLAADLPLVPCDISKAERGYRLFDAGSYSLSLPAPALHAEQPLDEVFAALAWHLLGSSQRLAEQYRFTGHWKLLEQWLQQLIDLRALLGSLGQAAPRVSSHALREALDALLADWRPRLTAGQLDEAARQAAPQQFAAELDDTRWGLFSLQLAHWLLARSWTQQRNPRGTRAGAAAIGRWLSQFLHEEIGVLPLENYQRQPSELPEQLPRLERMLVWLRLARGVLEVAETDRLYGELHKLHELAVQPVGVDDETTLPARAEQAKRVWMLKAWKALK
ncbi:MAG TPA: inorganic triphosphatase [Pseudomonas sp.]|uniref:CYTH domain-containing protein n=1 Tax=Pseudomonas sp. TaxID=306 RepID=UPI002BD8BB50|nr:inorganic triphosphatase [Pseudomonas sp.]HTO19307.1 inorganic triphosphatase [Pseudomonas sp.]